MRLISLLFLAAACGGATAESPLTVPLGLTHKDAESALHAHQFCHKQGELPQKQELYPRCDRTAAELGDAWVTAEFDGDRLIELRRWERYGDDAKAVERWNELVSARMKTSTASDEALQALRDKGLMEPGTRTVKAFGCGSFMTALDGSDSDHLTSLSFGRDRNSGFGMAPSA